MDRRDRLPPLPLAPLALVALLVLSTLAVPTVAGQPADNPCVGEMSGEADGTTVLSIQGVRFTSDGAEKTTATFLAVGPNGEVRWVHDASAEGRVWAYDVDPMENGTMLFTATERGVTVVEEWNPETGEHVWSQTFRGVTDAHDADLEDGEILLADKGEGHERLLAYNRSQRRTVWEWEFEDHYSKDAGGPPDDWTHVNDIDEIGEDRYLASVRNFDQVIVVNRSTDEIEMQLGEDEDHDILNEQHNPAYYEGPDGTPTILVADSRNDRVVEYEKTDDGWNMTYELVGGGLHEPRDADWLPNGNLLVTDRHAHRVMEVTPEGEVLWEFYTPWQPYDAERIRYGDEPDANTARELGVTGTHTLQSEAPETDDLEACEEYLNDFERETVEDPATPGEGTPDERAMNGTETPTETTAPDGQPGFGPVVAVAALVALAVGLLRRR
jgi:PGF-CTERM protein